MSKDPTPDTVMTFPDIDQAESALDWIGLFVAEDEGCFEGELDEDAAALLDEAFASDDTPQAVRALAAVLRERWRDDAAPNTYRVAYQA